MTPEEMADRFTTSPEHRAAFLRAVALDYTLATFQRLHDALTRFSTAVGGADTQVDELARSMGLVWARAGILDARRGRRRQRAPWDQRAALSARSGRRRTVRNAQWHARRGRLLGRRPGRRGKLMTDVTTFHCAACGRVEPFGDEDEALAVLARDFPGAEPSNCHRVCDACYDLLTHNHPAPTPS